MLQLTRSYSDFVNGFKTKMKCVKHIYNLKKRTDGGNKYSSTAGGFGF